MEKKIGIITFHDADNLGAVLQAYALQTKIKSLTEYKCEIIDYKCDAINKTKKGSRKINNPFKKVMYDFYYLIKGIGFKKFRKKYLSLSESYDVNTIQQVENDYDLFITGSDQVWNLACSNWDYNYYFDFIKKEDIKKCSYAASIGNYKFNEDEIIKVNNYLKKMDLISVREKETITLFNKDLNIDSVLDPVFLLNKEEWLALSSTNSKQKYVFVYLIQEDVNVLNMAKKYAEKYGYKIINNKKDLKFILNNSPLDFISWINNAEAVFTNSFHGTAFSLLLNKPLSADIAIRENKTNLRIKNLLKLFNAEQCILNPNIIEVNLPNAQLKIAEEREYSINYLKKCIKLMD